MLFHGPHCRGSAWCPPLSTMWERPPAYLPVFSPLQGDSVTLPSRGGVTCLPLRRQLPSALSDQTRGEAGGKVTPGAGDTNGKGRVGAGAGSAKRVVGGARGQVGGVAALRVGGDAPRPLGGRSPWLPMPSELGRRGASACWGSGVAAVVPRVRRCRGRGWRQQVWGEQRASRAVAGEVEPRGRARQEVALNGLARVWRGRGWGQGVGE